LQKSTSLAVKARALLSMHLRSAIQPLEPMFQAVCLPGDPVGEALLGPLGMGLIPHTVTSEPFVVTVRDDERVGWCLRFAHALRASGGLTRRADAFLGRDAMGPRVGWHCILDLFPSIHHDFIRTYMHRSQLDRNLVRADA
jgi:hypothetical protein